MAKNPSFFKGLVWGLVLGAILVVTSSHYSGNLKTDLLAIGNEIYAAHAHIQTEDEADKTIKAMASSGVKHMLLVGSPRQTIFSDGSNGFSDYDDNNQEILKISNKYPDYFTAFCAINPADSDKLSKLKECISQGGKGIKLYSGHGDFYDSDHPLDSHEMLEIYNYAQANNISVIFHVNSGKYREEFEKVLSSYPKMKVLCPYFCLSSSDLGRLEMMFNKHENLYTSIAFGYKDFAIKGFSRISAQPQKYKEFIEKHADRFLYGTGMVITGYEGKDSDWIKNNLEVYRDLLEKKKFNYFEDDSQVEYKGLSLSSDSLSKIYSQNYQEFIQ